MCKDNVDLPKEANKAKCFVIACFVLCASPGAHAQLLGVAHAGMRERPTMRSPADIHQLCLFTHCTCTAFPCSFFSCTAHTGAAPSSRSSAFFLHGPALSAASVGSSHASARASSCAAPPRMPSRAAESSRRCARARCCRAPTPRSAYTTQAPVAPLTPLAGRCAAPHRWHHPNHHVRGRPWVDGRLA